MVSPRPTSVATFALALALALAAAPAAADGDVSSPDAPPAAPDEPKGPLPEWGAGPIDFRNEFAVSLPYLSLAPDSPATLAAGAGRIALRGDIASTIVANDQFVIHAETWEGAMIVRYGLTGDLELGLEVPTVYRWKGVLDPTIRGIERAFGYVRNDRAHRPESEYAIEGTTDDGRAFHLREGTGLEKPRVSAKARLCDDPVAASLELAVALPVGSRGFVSSGADAGLRLALAKRLGPLVAYAGASATVIGGDLGPIDYVPAKLAAFWAIEYELTPWLSAVYEQWYETPTALNLNRINGLIVYHGGGLKARLGRFYVEVGVLENGGDVTTTADITNHVEIGVTF